MPKPKVVTRERLDAGPSGTKANRELTTMEKATSWIDEEGIISPEEGLKRVFEAARDGGTFTVCTRGDRPGAIDTIRYRTYGEALHLFVYWFNQQRRPLMYCATYNRDSQLLPRAAHKGKDGKWVSTGDATADEARALIDAWCRGVGIKDPPTKWYELIDTMRTIKRKFIKRERL